MAARARSGRDGEKRGKTAARDDRPANGDPADSSGDEITERICATLAEAIVNGALQPGVKLIEDVIAAHFSVSRTVVRGAIAILQRDHLVERRRNRGAFIAEPSADDARKLFDARRALEGAVIDRVVPVATEADIKRLHALTYHSGHSHHHHDEKEKHELSSRFHVELAMLTGNPVLVEYLEKTLARLSLVSARFGDQPEPEGCGDDEHRSLLDAIAARDTARARREMEAHLLRIEGLVRLDADHADRNSLQAVLERFTPKD
ncbi:MAG: GntR family transcriptional regulator [Bauldia sp.]